MIIMSKEDFAALYEAVEVYEETRWFSGKEGSPERNLEADLHYRRCQHLKEFINNMRGNLT